ncbi:hypothetical protein Scep_025867 [Stephania cephalantha]|uniref:Uncharacterized protein n=1 Tax=Stephania cephalantha TaxID=152367 RepID=A0AAP0EPM9_9MAGN
MEYTMECHASKVYQHGKNDEKLEMKRAYYASDNLRVFSQSRCGYISNTCNRYIITQSVNDELKQCHVPTYEILMKFYAKVQGKQLFGKDS